VATGCQLLIALRYLFLAKLVSRLFLPQHKQLILLPVALQSLRSSSLLSTRQSRYAASSRGSRSPSRIAFTMA